MNFLIKELENKPKFSEYISKIKEKISPIMIAGLSSVGKTQLIEATKKYTNQKVSS